MLNRARLARRPLNGRGRTCKCSKICSLKERPGFERPSRAAQLRRIPQSQFEPSWRRPNTASCNASASFRRGFYAQQDWFRHNSSRISLSFQDEAGRDNNSQNFRGRGAALTRRQHSQFAIRFPLYRSPQLCCTIHHPQLGNYLADKLPMTEEPDH
jgi:hypothetical protein